MRGNKGGRPYSENPKRTQFNVRLTDSEIEVLEKTCKRTGMSKADTVRTAIERLSRELEVK